MKRILIIIISLFLIQNTIAQGIENVISSGKEDASTYLGNYIQPVFKGLIYNINSGWYHTGKVHKKYGFDLTINANVSMVPDADKVFNFKNSDYTVLSLDGSATSMNLPTVMGQTSNQQINVRIPVDISGNPVPLGTEAGFKIYDFKTIDGIEENIKEISPIVDIPSPMVQVGLGLPSKTDLKLRFVPKVRSDDVSFNLFGMGLQHDLLQHFRKNDLDKKYKFDLSMLAAYTTTKTVYTPSNSSVAIDQETTIKVDGYAAQLIGNINLKIVDFYGSVGYTAGTSSLNVKGKYTYNYTFVGVSLPNVTETIDDPISINYSLSGMRATAGMRLNIKFFKIFADYTFQEYHTANAGIAFSFK